MAGEKGRVWIKINMAFNHTLDSDSPTQLISILGTIAELQLAGLRQTYQYVAVIVFWKTSSDASSQKIFCGRRLASSCLF